MVATQGCKRNVLRAYGIRSVSERWGAFPATYAAMLLTFVLAVTGTAQDPSSNKKTFAFGGSDPKSAMASATRNAASKSKPDAKKIWSDPSSPNSDRGLDCYFRRVMELPETEKAFVDIDSPSGCEVYFNGRRIRTMKSDGGPERIDLQAYIKSGKNLLAIRVMDRDRQQLGLKADFYFKPTKGNWRVVVSDNEWKATKQAISNWQMLNFNDEGWLAAFDLNQRTNTPKPEAVKDTAKGNDVDEIAIAKRKSTEDAESNVSAESARSSRKGNNEVAGGEKITISTRLGGSDTKESPAEKNSKKLKQRFTTLPGFDVEPVADSSIGSLIAMTFNEFGHIIASVEGDGLVLLYDTNKDGIPDKSRDYCDLVQNVQGILALNGDVYVTGEGSEGNGLYRLVDSDRNGQLEKSELLAKFGGTPGEHGAHQIAFGPDGYLYISIGNHAQLETPLEGYQPFTAPYEGDLVRPRFEDPGGHAMGVKAPGGTVVRYDLTSRKLSLVAGGFRNAYDLAFHPNGNMYLHDSDMEADIGSVWHRPTGLFRVVEGGEFGWRSGWANWPEYYPDRLPSLASTGRGSPTGITVYNHFAFPARYHRAIFTADWSEGRIIALQIDAADRGRVKAEDFVVGTPMNVTDLEVGPDGALYFCTGGRGTEGGIFRVKWQGELPETVKNLGEGISRAIRQPQLSSAFARQSVAILKRELGEQWDEQVMGVAFSEENPSRYRLQAIDLMQLLGPIPSSEMLIELSSTANEQVRAKSARLLGLHAGDEAAANRLKRMIQDTSPMVRSAACEALIRTAVACDPSELQPLLASDQREDRYLGRRLLMNVPADAWKEKLLKGKPRVAINASLALVSTNRDTDNCKLAIDALLEASKGFVSDAEFVDLLRTLQVSLHVSSIQPDRVPELKRFVEQEFPTGNPAINGELIRLATFLQSDLVVPAIEYLKTDANIADRMLISMHLPLMPHEWKSSERMAVLQFLESCLKEKTGGSYPLYVMKTSETLSKYLTETEAIQIIDLGERYPNAALAALFKVPDQLTPDQIESLKRLDTAIDKGGLEEDVYKRLKTGITAILSQQSDDSAMEYLRQRWRKSPDRRATIALAMAQRPSEANWDYLVRSMGVLDLFAIADVCNALCKIDAATEDPEAIRQTILQGCRLVEAGDDPSATIKLLEYWTGEKLTSDLTGTDSPMLVWQKWFEKQFPNSPPAVLPSETTQPRWSLAFLDQFLNGEQGKAGSIEKGAEVYARARCSACHKMNAQGGGFGPDLTSLNRRFTRTESLESILFPSHVISDQYATKKVLTKTGDVYTGLVVKTAKGIAVRVNENKEYMIADDEIDELMPSKVSAMPTGLLDELTPTEIRDLMVFLGYIPTEKLTAEKPSTIRR